MDLRISLSLLVLAGSIGVITAVSTPIDCSLVRCGRPLECNPEDLVTPLGQCCPICGPDCSAVLCAKPECEEREVIETPPGECCPVCTRPDCAAVLCLALTDQDCDDDEVLVTPPGECCARCQQDCSAVSCLRPVCMEGEMLEVPDGECCPVCVKEAQCEIEGQVFSDCASPCPQTCDSGSNQICITLCIQGCTCPPGQVIDTVNNRCVTTDMCPPTVCTIKGQEFSFCPGCDSTCIDVINEELRFCPAICRPGCGCPETELIDTISGQCVPREECTNPCALVDCKPGFRCKVNRTTNEVFCAELSCAEVSCLKPDCEEGETLKTPPGECCPVCTRPDCAAVLCLALTDQDCDDGEVLVTPPGECCARCQRDCSAVSCLRPVCEEGEILDVPEGECCPICVPGVDCSAVFCLRPVCEEGEILDVPEGECCPICVPGIDCSAVSCLRPVCEEGEILDVPEGECCPVCFNPCAVVDCALGFECKVDVRTNRPFCEPSCEISNGGCAKDEICQLTVVQCVTTPCPPIVRCLSKDDVCSLPEQVGPCKAAIPRYNYNSSSGQCEPFIYGGCQGNANNFESLNECQIFCGAKDPCSKTRCRPGHRCEIFKPTGEAFCAPDCSLDNGGCSKGELCTLQQVQCIRAPCPPVVQCLSRCAAVRCRSGHRCEIFEPTGEPFCAPDCSLDNGGCSNGELCTLQQVQCIRAPCPPVVQCLNRCATVRCLPGHRCEIDKETGEVFCNPDCRLDNGGCRSDQICELKPVICVRAPCPPVVQCSCPPPCSREYCRNNAKGLCSSINSTFGPPENPGCTGACRLSYCKACFYSSDEVVEPQGLSRCRECSDLDDYSRPSVCYWRWSRCAGNLFWKANRPNRRIGEYSTEHIQCPSPPCPRRG